MDCTVKFCKTNYSNGSAVIKELAQKNPNLNVVEANCLGNCGQCYMETFAVVNEKVIAVRSYEDLQEEISQQYAMVK